MNWIITVVVIVVIGFILDREIYFYEGVHLGPRVQAWLYNRWSKKYDEGKRASQLQDDGMLVQPLLDAMKDVPEAFVLDFATGTGRLTYALVSRPEFGGHIIALDLSQGMLEQAASKLIPRAEQREPRDERSRSARSVELLRHQSLPLPFPDATFDVVCALEVLELFPAMDEPLSELTRILRPGGILLTSRGTEESGRKARIKSAKAFTALLEAHGFERVQITRWWTLFDRVIAVKRGASALAGGKRLAEVLRCSTCSKMQWQEAVETWQCQNCGRQLTITEQRIVLN